jgi:hypothetical protein
MELFSLADYIRLLGGASGYVQYVITRSYIWI